MTCTSSWSARLCCTAEVGCRRAAEVVMVNRPTGLGGGREEREGEKEGLKGGWRVTGR